MEASCLTLGEEACSPKQILKYICGLLQVENWLRRLSNFLYMGSISFGKLKLQDVSRFSGSLI
jgi:hypothetical protein